MPAPDEVNAPLTVRELIAELQELPDQDLPVMFAAVSPNNTFDRVAYRVIHQNFTQEYVWWDDEIGEYRIADEMTEGVVLPTAWVMN